MDHVGGPGSLTPDDRFENSEQAERHDRMLHDVCFAVAALPGKQQIAPRGSEKQSRSRHLRPSPPLSAFLRYIYREREKIDCSASTTNLIFVGQSQDTSPSSRHLPSSPPLYGSPLHWCKPLGCRAPLPPLTAPAAPQHPATRPCGPLVRMSRRSHGEGSRRKRTSWACQGASNGQESQC